MYPELTLKKDPKHVATAKAEWSIWSKILWLHAHMYNASLPILTADILFGMPVSSGRLKLAKMVLVHCQNWRESQI